MLARTRRNPILDRLRRALSSLSQKVVRRDQGSSGAFGSQIDRVTRLFLSMSPEQLDLIFRAYRDEYGDAAEAYARRTIRGWKPGKVRKLGRNIMRLLPFVPPHVDHEAKFELARILREETLRSVTQTERTFYISPEASLTNVIFETQRLVDQQIALELPSKLFENQIWLKRQDALAFQELIRAGEARLLEAQMADFIRRVRLLQATRRANDLKANFVVVFRIPTALVTVSVVDSNSQNRMNEHEQTTETHLDDSGLLSKWTDLELETRFKTGEISYPEYVLRNMDQFFTKEEQSELHKIAAMHGLELERQLMEIQIKSRTSEVDVQKLLKTLRDLQEKKITADVVSRHETPSGHIEISAKSRGAGCVPGIGGVFLLLALLIAFFA